MKSDKSDKSHAKSPGKVFDVRRPGRAPASPTSRPVIVGHRQEAEQTQAAVSGVGDNSRPLMSHKRKLEIQAPAGDITEKPRLQSTTTVKDEQPAQSKETQEALATTAMATTTESPVEKFSKTEAPISAPTPIPPAVLQPTPEEIAPQSSIPADTTPDLAAPVPKLEETEPEFEDLIVVSRHKAKTSVWEVVLLVVLFIVLAVAVVDVLLDLAILDLPLPHTNFFVE